MYVSVVIFWCSFIVDMDIRYRRGLIRARIPTRRLRILKGCVIPLIWQLYIGRTVWPMT